MRHIFILFAQSDNLNANDLNQHFYLIFPTLKPLILVIVFLSMMIVAFMLISLRFMLAKRAKLLS
jgi:hypothetical protein